MKVNQNWNAYGMIFYPDSITNRIWFTILEGQLPVEQKKNTHTYFHSLNSLEYIVNEATACCRQVISIFILSLIWIRKYNTWTWTIPIGLRLIATIRRKKKKQKHWHFLDSFSKSHTFNSRVIFFVWQTKTISTAVYLCVSIKCIRSTPEHITHLIWCC